MVKVLNKIGSHASSKKRLKSLANKCEALSREYTKLRDKSCVCGCGKTTGLDWAHAVTRERELIKYHILNTFRLNHDCHLMIDLSKDKYAKMEELQRKRLSKEEYAEWERLRSEAAFPFKANEDFYLNQIAELGTHIKEVEYVIY